MANGNVKGFAILALEFRKEGRYWVGRCRELGTATDGRSLEKVVRELTQLVTLDVNGLEELGEREHLFSEPNITFCTDERSPEIMVLASDPDDNPLLKPIRIPVEASELALASA